MNIEQVIQYGDFTIIERFLNLFLSPWPNMQQLVAFVSGSTVAMIVFSLFAIYVLKLDEKWGLSAKLSCGLIMVFFIFLAFVFLGQNYEKGPYMKQWNEDYFQPYLHTLETKKLEIEELKKLQDAGKRYLYEINEDELLPVSFVYTDENEKKIRFDSKSLIVYDLKENESPYLEYQKLPQTVKGYKKGIINPIVHVPIDYRF